MRLLFIHQIHGGVDGTESQCSYFKFTILDKILKNLGFIAIWVDSS
jgi:hypothetical protein